MIPPGFRRFPQPPERKPMSIEAHKMQIDWINQDQEAADDMLHEMLCIVYPTVRDQSN